MARKAPGWALRLAKEAAAYVESEPGFRPAVSARRVAWTPPIHWRVGKGGHGLCSFDHISVTVSKYHVPANGCLARRSTRKEWNKKTPERTYVLLHELAHWYTWRLGGPHGNGWGFVCYELCKRFGVPDQYADRYNSTKRARKASRRRRKAGASLSPFWTLGVSQ